MKQFVRSKADEISIVFIFHKFERGSKRKHCRFKMFNPMMKLIRESKYQEMKFLDRKISHHSDLLRSETSKIIYQAAPIRRAFAMHPNMKKVLFDLIRQMLQG